MQNKVKALKSSKVEVLREKENSLREIKGRGDELVRDKLDHDKLINKITNKINEFMREYPNHEKEKEQKAKEEHRRRIEEKERQRQIEVAEKQRKKLEKELKLADEQDDDGTPTQDWQGNSKSD